MENDGMRDDGFMIENGEVVHIKDTFVKQTRDNSLYFSKYHLGLYRCHCRPRIANHIYQSVTIIEVIMWDVMETFWMVHFAVMNTGSFVCIPKEGECAHGIFVTLG